MSERLKGMQVVEGIRVNPIDTLFRGQGQSLVAKALIDTHADRKKRERAVVYDLNVKEHKSSKKYLTGKTVTHNDRTLHFVDIPLINESDPELIREAVFHTHPTGYLLPSIPEDLDPAIQHVLYQADWMRPLIYPTVGAIGAFDPRDGIFKALTMQFPIQLLANIQLASFEKGIRADLNEIKAKSSGDYLNHLVEILSGRNFVASVFSLTLTNSKNKPSVSHTTLIYGAAEGNYDQQIYSKTISPLDFA